MKATGTKKKRRTSSSNPVAAEPQTTTDPNRPMEKRAKTLPLTNTSTSTRPSPLDPPCNFPALTNPSTNTTPPLGQIPFVALTPSSITSVSNTSNRGVTRYPDLWLLVVAAVGKLIYRLVSIIGEAKIHSMLPGATKEKERKAREAYTQAIMYLSAAYEVCGTWLGFVLVDTKWGRLCVLAEVSDRAKR